MVPYKNKLLKKAGKVFFFVSYAYCGINKNRMLYQKLPSDEYPILVAALPFLKCL